MWILALVCIRHLVRENTEVVPKPEWERRGREMQIGQDSWGPGLQQGLGWGCLSTSASILVLGSHLFCLSSSQISWHLWLILSISVSLCIHLSPVFPCPSTACQMRSSPVGMDDGSEAWSPTIRVDVSSVSGSFVPASSLQRITVLSSASLPPRLFLPLNSNI